MKSEVEPRFKLRDVGAWFDENMKPILVALVLCSWLVNWNLHSTEDAHHDADCSSARARTQSVEDFWNAKATKRHSHALDELGASGTWSAIRMDLARDHVGDARLSQHIGDISRFWIRLKRDDDGEADVNRSYVAEVERNFNSSCGIVPTPHPAGSP